MKQPHLLIGEGDINDTVLLPGDPGRVDFIGEKLDDSSVVSYNREFKIVNGRYKNIEVSVCSTGAGSPSAAIVMEELHRVGVEEVIRVGTCGALQPFIDIGDLVIPTGAAKFEGTTKRYEGVEYPAIPSLNMVQNLEKAAGMVDIDVFIGSIVTDDAFYAEDEPSENWMEANMMAVEMEASTIFTLARRNGMKSCCIVAVDGNLVKGSQKGETEKEELPDLTKRALDKEIDIALNSLV